jgi:hypothetical protein
MANPVSQHWNRGWLAALLLPFQDLMHRPWLRQPISEMKILQVIILYKKFYANLRWDRSCFCYRH